MTVTTIQIQRVFFRWDEAEQMDRFNKTSYENGYFLVSETAEGRTYERKKTWFYEPERIEK